jgi:protein-L-isoaspartate(D-aspartate) O-methyltransferase
MSRMRTFALVAGVLAAIGWPAVSDGQGGWASARADLVRRLANEGVRDREVLRAIGSVPRHEFVPDDVRAAAYEDRALPIGEGQTISQPRVVALMTALAAIRPGDRVLEVGTGSGYQAAVLAELGAQVYSIEILPALARRARATLERLGYHLQLRTGDGYRGWPEAAPFAAILVTAAPSEVPAPLRQQLAVGGRMVIPVGEGDQELRVVTRTRTGFEERVAAPVRFVPMTGEAIRR